MSKFPELPPTVTALEDEVLERWRAEGTFRQSLEKTANGKPFVFYEGPPTANGRPGIHHVLSRTIKDTVARFRTMQGRWVPRMAGWDTHGLPGKSRPSLIVLTVICVSAWRSMNLTFPICGSGVSYGLKGHAAVQ